MIWVFFGVFDKMTINLHVRNLRDFIANIIIAQDNFTVRFSCLGVIVLLFCRLIIRSSRLEVFCKKGVYRNFTKLTGKHLCQSLFFCA